MMSAPEIDLAALAHLNFEYSPECEGVRHNGGPRPPAQLWIQMHGCLGAALCIQCQQAHADWVNMMLRIGKCIQCTGCGRAFASYRTLITQVMPI